MPCIKFAVVTAMLGSRDRMLPAPKQECAQFFLFTKLDPDRAREFERVWLDRLVERALVTQAPGIPLENCLARELPHTDQQKKYPPRAALVCAA